MQRQRYKNPVILLLASAVIFLSFGMVFAQASETFDIATFQPPKGWKRQDKPGVVVFSTSNEQKGSYAMIMLYPSGNSSGNAKNDFDGDWAEFIAGQFEVKGKPAVEPIEKKDGWEVVSGGVAFENEMGPSAVILNTYSGFGKTFSAAAVFNSQDNLPAIVAFASSIKLKQPAATSQQKQPEGAGAASVVGTWGTNVVVRSTAATSYAGTAGSNIRQYKFNEDGTYNFAVKTFSFSNDKLMLIKENGIYQISGNNITVIPQKSVTQSWSKKDGTDQWGRLLTTQNRKAETVTYRFTKDYSSTMEEWRLVFQADRPNERDGPFNGGTAFSDAWIYSTPCDKCLLELPR